VDRFTVAEEHRARVRGFADVFLATSGDGLALGVPDEMRVPEESDGEWVAWKAIPSTICEADIAALEEQVAMAFPPLFKAFLLDRCLLMTDFVVRLPQTPSNAPLRELMNILEPVREGSFFEEQRLLPFGHDSNDAGPACFDTKKRRADGDCPVVIVDLGRIREAGYAGEPPNWESFAALLDEIQRELEAYR